MKKLNFFLKKYLPNFVVIVLQHLRRESLHIQKIFFSKLIRLKHQNLLTNISTKDKIKVVFLVIHKSVWKVDTVFKKMLLDPYFEPLILVCPYINDGEKRMYEELDITYDFFIDKSYPVLNSFIKDSEEWIKLEELKPDLIFFTNPHKITMQEYYEDAYKKYLSCYVPYFYLVTAHGDGESIYNHYFHNAMWKIFLPHEDALVESIRTSANNGINGVITGYPSCESFFKSKYQKFIWKAQLSKKKKIIWAPHHTIDTSYELQLSNFLIYAELFKNLSLKYKDFIQWSFKPHPMLKEKLYKHDKWGIIKTDLYFKYWQDSSNTQLDSGEYEDLFLESDAMIHDCGSFLIEYLYIQKPVLYLMTSRTLENLNSFGKKGVNACYTAKSISDIEEFVESVLKNKIGIKTEHIIFYKEEILPYFKNISPSEKIIKIIKGLK